MKNLNNLSSLLQLVRKNRIGWFIGVMGSFFLLLPGFAPVMPPGIDNPSPFNAYLNNVFPSEDPSGGNFSWSVENAFPNLDFVDPLAILEIPDEDSYYVVGKLGSVWQIPDDPNTTTKDEVLNISSVIEYDTDAGLMNGALHPEFGQAGSPNRGYIYLFYRYHPDGEVGECTIPAFLRLSRFNRPDGQQNFDPSSELVMMQIYDEHCWHNGGGMFFDEEGYLYLTIGDAGGEDDYYENTQRLDELLLSGLFRIDVDMDPSRSHPIRRQQVDPADKPANLPSSYSQGYYIPNDNPWLDPNGGILEEYYTLGLRSPHRATMDPVTGDIWMGDVGQGTREEISILPKGGNVEWPFMEGSIPGQKPEPNPLIGFKQPPIYDYGRSEGNAVIGGFVYRGGQFNGALDGLYVFGDHGSRNVWSLNPENGEVTYLTTVPDTGSGFRDGISSFGTNSRGDLFIVRLYGYNAPGGVIYKLKQESSIPDPPQFLSQTGAFSDLASLTPAAGFVPYTVNSPLWSDRAEKKRWIAVPNDGDHNSAGEQITFSPNGPWQFPSGTVLMKHFELPLDYNDPENTTVRLETRFIIITDSGGAYGVTYKWNEQGTDAELLIGGETVDYDVVFPDGSTGTQSWDFPSRTACKTCHNANADFVLGVKTWQLNGMYEYPSQIVDNQLNTWLHLGMFANPFDPNSISGFLRSAAIDDVSATPELRVRSYLDANCSHCHQPDGVEGAFDARFSTPLSNQNIVNAFAISRNTEDGQYVVKPRSTLESELWMRDQSLDDNPMPPLAKNLIDNEYISVLTEWINSMEEGDCEDVPVSLLTWTTPPQNHLGPVEKDESNGGAAAGDGNTITINGQQFAKGLGVHAPSTVTYEINGAYSIFQSYIGVDDEACGNSSVRFEVYADEVMVYQSPVVTQSTDPILVELNVTDVDELKLVVTDAGDGTNCDHADWADPVLVPCINCTDHPPCDDGDPCTTDDRYDDDCNCAGTLIDSDNDGVCDAYDQCPGFDDNIDTNNNGIPDPCEAVGCLDPEDEVCPTEDCDFTEDPLTDGGYYAYGEITSSGWVPDGGTVTFKAGQSIRLLPGFHVDNGGEFSAFILECVPDNLVTQTPEETANVESAVKNLTPVVKPQNDLKQEYRYQYDLSVEVWPNPFRENISLTIAAPTPDMKRATIQIMDVNGRIIYQRFNAPFDELITINSLSNWASGAYIMRVHASNYYYSQTLIKD